MTATDTGTALLHSILANPADDAPRLIYADWLDEQTPRKSLCDQCKGLGGKRREGTHLNGRNRFDPCSLCSGSGQVTDGIHERAEFIRSQIFCSHYTDCPTRLKDMATERPLPLRCGVCDYCKNRRRAEFLSHHFLHLPEAITAYGFCLDPTPPDGEMIVPNDGITVLVRRGFVSEVHLPLAQFLQHARTIAATQPVMRWVLTDREPEEVHRDKWGWYIQYNVNGPSTSEHEKSWLTPEFSGFIEIQRTLTNIERFSKVKDTREEALADLQRFCYDWARVGQPYMETR